MNIAIDTSPLITDHKVRGTGFYVLRLTDALKKYFPENTYTFFTDKKDIPKEADLIHYPYFDPFSLTVPFENSNKTVVSVLDLTPIVFPKEFPAGIKGNLNWQIQKQALKRIAGVVTLSEASKKDIIKFTSISPERVYASYLAAGEEFRKIKNERTQKKNIKEKYNLPDKFALYVGDVTWNKNVPSIMQAAINTDIPLVMVGKALVNDNFDKSNKWNLDLIKAQQMAKENENISLLGFVSDEDLVFIYNLATVFIMPSRYEGFGLPILEAMQCGCPVITGNKSSLPEVAGDAAFFVDASSTDDISKGLRKIFSSPKQQELLSAKGLEHSKKFSWEKTARETLSFYESILKNIN